MRAAIVERGSPEPDEIESIHSFDPGATYDISAGLWGEPFIALEWPAVKALDLFYFYRMGTLIGSLAEIELGDNRNGYRFRATPALRFLRDLTIATTSVLAGSLPEAVRLRDAVEAVITSENGLVVGDEVARVRVASRDFDTAFRQVLGLESATTFHVSRVGLYDTRSLLEHADQAFPEAIRGGLSEQTRRDWNAAGRCLGFGLGTACGFHAIRATESVIHQYYVTVTADVGMKRKDRNWGAYVRNLNRHRNQHIDSKADSKLIALIDQIREHHRNVVMHPEESLTDEQAGALFNICQSAITSFVAEIGVLTGTNALS